VKFGLKDILYLTIILSLCGYIYFLFQLDKNLKSEIVSNNKLLSQHFEEITTSVENLQSHKDSSIATKATEVKAKIDDLKEKLSNKNISDFEKETLRKELVKVKKEFDEYQSSIMFNMIDMIDAKDNEITLLNNKMVRVQKQLENCSGGNTTLITHKVHNQKIIAALSLNVMPVNRKGGQTYKARNVAGLQCEFRISGDLQDVGFNHINLVVIDSNGKTISSEKDTININSKDFTFFFTCPAEYHFKSGKYTVKATNERSEFEAIYSFTLSGKF
jgi:hypothetical protein